MANPTSIREIDLTPIAGKSYLQHRSRVARRDLYFLMVNRVQDDVVRPVTAGAGRSTGISTPNSFYGGTIKGVTRNLDYIAGLRCTAI
jgi:hypothetical protein